MYQPLIKFHPYPAIITQVLSIFDCVLDTRARQYSNKFDIALAYSYLCSGSGGAAGERQRSRSEPDRKSDER